MSAIRQKFGKSLLQTYTMNTRTAGLSAAAAQQSKEAILSKQMRG